MRIKIFMTVVFAVFFVVIAGPLAKGAQDGVWWNQLTANQKIVYVVGFFDGQAYAEKLFDGAVLIAQADPKTKLWSPERAKILVEAEDMALKMLKHDFGRLTLGQMTDGLDKIYTDYRNARIVVKEAIIVVVRSVDGEMSDEDITKLLERKRREASN
jgi:hypothetical protein